MVGWYDLGFKLVGGESTHLTWTSYMVPSRFATATRGKCRGARIYTACLWCALCAPGLDELRTTTGLSG